jgi:ferrous iron transport protein A
MTSPSLVIVPLTELRPGEQATFLEFGTNHPLLGRLITLGFTPGATVEVTQNNGRGPLLISVRGSFVALGRDEAGHIIVRRSTA